MTSEQVFAFVVKKFPEITNFVGFLQDHLIDGPTFCSLTNEHLEKLHVHQLGVRHRLLRLIPPPPIENYAMAAAMKEHWQRDFPSAVTVFSKDRIIPPAFKEMRQRAKEKQKEEKRKEKELEKKKKIVPIVITDRKKKGRLL